MASSSGSLYTSGNSYPFMSATASFSDLLNSDTHRGGGGLSDHVSERTGSGVPKFKSIPPPSLPISPPSSLSPSSYFAIPPGLSLAELLDSPVILSTSSILPSPTTGTFPALGFNWKSNYGNNQQNIKQVEDKKNSDFSFQTQTKPSTTIPTAQEQEAWNFHEPTKQDDYDFSSVKSVVKSAYASVQSFSPEISNIQTNTQSNNGFQSDCSNYQYQSESIREQKRSEDGYNWRKYGQKQVKGSENPRSYYKCTHPNCAMKKKVERSIDGEITEIVYKGSHNHPKPLSTRRSSSSGNAIQTSKFSINEIPDQCFATQQIESVATPENSSISMGDEGFEQSSQKSKSGGDELDENEPDAKRWKKESENEGISAAGSRTVREPRVVVQTTSEIDILDDGYRWRKYGQKVVRGNPNPRSYYKCTNIPGCPVRKHVERASHDLRAVITTYEGKHNHDVPTARGGGSHSVNRLQEQQQKQQCQHNNETFSNKISQSPAGSFGYSGFGNSVGSYVNQIQSADMFPRAKEELRDDLFLNRC